MRVLPRRSPGPPLYQCSSWCSARTASWMCRAPWSPGAGSSRRHRCWLRPRRCWCSGCRRSHCNCNTGPPSRQSAESHQRMLVFKQDDIQHLMKLLRLPSTLKESRRHRIMTSAHVLPTLHVPSHSPVLQSSDEAHVCPAASMQCLGTVSP